MGHDLAELTGASVPVGSTLESKIAPLTMKDWGELEAWMKQRPFAVLNGNGTIPPPALSPSEREAAVVEAMRLAIDITVFGPYGRQLLASPDGTITWLFLSLRAKEPKSTWDEAARMFTYHGHASVMKILSEINGIIPKESNKGNAQAPDEKSSGEKSSIT